MMGKPLLTLCYGCGLRAGEVCRLRVGDIDSELKIIRVVQAKGRKDRHVMLPPEVLGSHRWQASSGQINPPWPAPGRHSGGR